MNIFFVHPDPREAARHLCDKHICKMILESVQMLSTAHREGESPYGCIKSHINHPCTKWARETHPNYHWLVEHLLEMCVEYTNRYGKTHKMEEAARWLKDNRPTCIDRPAAPMTKPPQCMPDDCKCDDGFFWDAVEGYRKYYRQEKSYFAKWKNGNEPIWFKKG